MKESEKVLVAQARSGDVHAFALLYENVYKDLYRFACCMVKNTHKAEDVVSESVLHAFENIHKLHKTTSFRNWIFQITANECRKQFRYQNRFVDPGENNPEETGYTPDFTERIAIQQAFSQLGDEERLIVGLSLFGGYSGREISRFLHKKEGTVRSSKSRALDKMKQFLEGIE